MKKGQTLIKDGKHYIGFPMEYMNITQGNNGQFSHQGVNAIDLAGKDGGIDETLAIGDMRLVAWDSAANGNAIFVESLHPYTFADDTENYFTAMYIHDNDISDIIAWAQAGNTWKQGDPIGDEGTAGFATGNHCHFEIAKGKFSHMYDQNPTTKVFHLPNSISADKACVTDGTVILNSMSYQSDNGNKMSWKTMGSAGGTVIKKSNMEEERWGAKFINDTPITIHKDTSNGPAYGTWTKGEKVTYTHKGVGNGHRWIGWTEGSQFYVCAISGSEERGKDMWVELFDPTPKPQKEEPKEEIKPDFTKNIKHYGIDISSNNGEINLEGQDFVIIRACYGTNEDTMFKQNVEECNRLGIPFGVYCYSYALDSTGAKEEADYILELIKDIDVPLGIWFDMEDADGYKSKRNVINSSNITTMVQTFCDICSKAGYYVGYYCSSNWLTNYILGVNYPIWLANWGTNNGEVQGDFSDVAVIHQYSAVGVDKNAMYVDFEKLKSNPIDQDEKSIFELILELIQRILEWFRKKKDE